MNKTIIFTGRKFFNHMKRKGFMNIAIVILILVLAGAFGYFAFVRNSTLVVEQYPTEQTPTQPSTTDTGKKPTTSDTAEYPYILKPIPQDQLATLRSEFTASNGNVCTTINEYGFTEIGNICLDQEIVKIEITDEKSIVEVVKTWLVQNSKFTGITKKSDAVVDGLGSIGCVNCETPILERKGILLKIQFRGQTYNGLPVEGDISPLIVFANVNGVSRIDGYWFPKIIVPLEPKISEISAKNKLIGRTFTYGGIGGQPITTAPLESKDLNNAAHKVVFVKKSSQGLEFRLAWKILVGEGLSWTVYIDAVTGEELKIVQMFQT